VGRLVLTDDRISAAGKAGAGYGLSATEVLDSPHFLIGTVEQTAADLERRRERWGISYWTLSSGNVEGGNNMQDFARLIRRLAG
jgi:carbohydrate-selective porin OprB